MTFTDSQLTILTDDKFGPERWKRAVELIRSQGLYGNNQRRQVPALVAAFAMASILAHHEGREVRKRLINQLLDELTERLGTLPVDDFSVGLEIAFQALNCNVVTFEDRQENA